MKSALVIRDISSCSEGLSCFQRDAYDLFALVKRYFCTNGSLVQAWLVFVRQASCDAAAAAAAVVAAAVVAAAARAIAGALLELPRSAARCHLTKT